MVLASGQRTRIPLDPLPFKIGRGPDNHLIVRDSRASRAHARILIEGETYVIEDLKSRHGVWLNGRRVERRAVLNSGDSIHFGFENSYLLHFSLAESAVTRILDKLKTPETRPASSDALSRLQSLVEVARSLQNPIASSDILAAVVDAAISATRAERGFLLLWKDDQLEVAVARDASGRPLSSTELNVPLELIHKSLRERPNLLTMTPNLAPAWDASEFRNVVCVPLVRLGSFSGQETIALSAADSTTGLLYLDSRRESEALSSTSRDLLQTLAVEASGVLENARLLDEERARQRLERELAFSREVQRSLLPARLPSSGWFRAAGSCLPSLEIAGDYVDVRSVGDDCWCVVVADVSGKGLSSALLASLLQGSFVVASDAQLATPTVLGRLNSFLYERAQGEKYSTIFWGDVTRSGKLRYVNAGHCCPFLVTQTGSVQELSTTGLPLGILPQSSFGTAEIELHAGDKVVAFTDGLPDAENAAGEEFGARLKSLAFHLATLSAQQMHDSIMREVQEFSVLPLPDDVTLLVFEYAGAGEQG